MLYSEKNDCHSERSEEPPYFVFAFAIACSLILCTYSKTALAPTVRLIPAQGIALG
jgi:hypothetical protein